MWRLRQQCLEEIAPTGKISWILQILKPPSTVLLLHLTIQILRSLGGLQAPTYILGFDTLKGGSVIIFIYSLFTIALFLYFLKQIYFLDNFLTPKLSCHNTPNMFVVVAIFTTFSPRNFEKGLLFQIFGCLDIIIENLFFFRWRLVENLFIKVDHFKPLLLQSALAAFVLLFSTVCFQMIPQMAYWRRCNVTLVAFYWFFPCVCFQMCP